MKYTIQSPDGRKITIEAADEATAMRGAKEWAAANPAGNAAGAAPADVQGDQPPQGAVPGSRAYADWAAAQARAGHTLPQRGPAPPELSDPISQMTTAAAAGIDSVPFIGDKLSALANQGRAAIQTSFGHPMTAQDVAAETATLRKVNPVANVTGEVLGPTVALAPLGATALGSRLLGMTGSLASRVGFGALSGGTIAGGDQLARTGDWGQAAVSGAEGAAIGGAFPVATKGLGWLSDLVLGRVATKDAQNVARALRDDGIHPNQVNQQLQQMGPDAMVMDLGPNLQAQAGAVASVPGPGQRIVRDAVAARGRGASARVTNDVTQTIGNGPDITTLRNQIITQQSQAADPLYAAVRNIPLTNLPALAAVARTPMGRQALTNATTMLANDGIRLPQGQFTVGLADYMKRALDDIAASSARAGNNNVARQARNMTRAITSTVDRQVPAYRAARDAFAGPAQVMDALDLGTTAFSREMSPTQLRTELAGMSPSERQAFLHGAQSQVEAMMGNAVNDVASLRNTFRKGWNEAKLRILLGPQIADDLLQRIDRELAYGQTSNAVAGNSETARRQAGQSEVDPKFGVVNKPSIDPVRIAYDAFNAARNAIQGVMQPRINAGMARTHIAGQLSPAMMRALQNGARATAPGVLPPAGVAVGIENQRRPVQITVGR